MKPKVDQDKCIGCGTCASLCPSVFKLNELGKSEVISNNYDNCDLKEVVSSCPSGAISLEK